MKRILVFLILASMLAACSAPTATSQAPVVNTQAPVVNTQPPVATMAPATATVEPTVPPTEMVMPTETSMPTQASVPVTGAQTYTVTVGAMDMNNAADLMAFFPAKVQIHTGDAVLWKQNDVEIHTVTFLGNGNTELPAFTIPVPGAPQGAMMLNPLDALPSGPTDGKYDGTGMANSGLMGLAQGQTPQYQLTFTKAGTYNYICAVHGQVMSGTVEVVDASQSVPAPSEATAQGKQEMDALMAKIPGVVSAAQAMQQPDVKNADGSTTHNIMIGYSDGQIDLMAFFPKQVNVKQGDTVVWTLGQKDIAPHTVTFLNGTEDPETIIVKPQPSGPPFLLFNPAVAVPANMGQPLTSTGMYNSGLMVPEAPPTHTYSLKIGNVSGQLEYICLLHDASGMKGNLVVAP